MSPASLSALAVRSSEDTPVLAASNLSIFLEGKQGPVKIVEGLDISIAPREFFALVGESGSGKTVFARSIMRLYSRSAIRFEGHLRIAGTDVVNASDAQLLGLRRKHVSMIFQEPMTSLNPLMAVGRQIGEAIEVSGTVSRPERSELVDQLLVDVQFGDPDAVRGMFPHEMSGGMRQRAMIAIALAKRPALLVADEPTTALDVVLQREILELLLRLRDAYGVSILFISHDLGLVHRYADRVGVLYGGVLMETGEARSLIEDPSHPYTAALVSCIPRRRTGNDRQSGLDGAVPDATNWFDGCRFAPRCAAAAEMCRTGAVPAVAPRPGRLTKCRYPL
jgi:oligopeptide/dipeptide ABC transporter ATP-binding protein